MPSKVDSPGPPSTPPSKGSEQPEDYETPGSVLPSIPPPPPDSKGLSKDDEKTNQTNAATSKVDPTQVATVSTPAAAENAKVEVLDRTIRRQRALAQFHERTIKPCKIASIICMVLIVIGFLLSLIAGLHRFGGMTFIKGLAVNKSQNK